jgi:replicative DNA helicase
VSNGMPKTDRLPPHSPEAEMAVVGCILLLAGPSLNLCAERKVSQEWFYDLRHADVFNVCKALDAAQKPVDLISVQQALKDAGTLEAVGGVAALMAAQDSVPSAENLSYYLDLLREKFLLRRLVKVCTLAVDGAYGSPESAEKFILGVEAEISKLTEDHAALVTEKTGREVMRAVANDIEENHYVRGRTQLRGLATGPDGGYLDKMIRGIRESYYVVLAGRPGDGKTSKAMNIVEYVSQDYVWHEPTGRMVEREEDGRMVSVPEAVERKGAPVMIFSIEMDSTSLGYRMLFGRAGVDTAQYSMGFKHRDDDAKIMLAQNQIANSPIYIDDTPGQTIGQIAAKARRAARQYGIKLFVLDYLQLVELEGTNGMDRVRELTKVSRKIMALKKQLKVPWLVLAQMNRDIEKAETKRVPLMSDLKDCGAIEQDADVVALLYKPDQKKIWKKDPETGEKYAEPTDDELIQQALAGEDWSRIPRRVNIFIAKNRNGPVGHVEEVFCPNLCRFEDKHLFFVKHGIAARNKGESPNNVQEML